MAMSRQRCHGIDMHPTWSSAARQWAARLHGSGLVAVKPLLRYGAVGLFNGAIFFLTFYLCIDLLHIDRWIAVLIAFSVSTTSQYLGHSIVTFQKNVGDAPQLIRFIVTIGLGLVIAQAIMLGGPHIGLPDIISGGLVVVALVLVNWVVFFLWVFKGAED
jgi:putative flippase GtrA